MIRSYKALSAAILLALITVVSACAEKTFVLVTVDVDEAITEPITELRFDSLVTDGASIFNQDSQRFEAGGKPIRFPQSFVVLANGWGSNGETVGMVVEAYGADGNVLARARGQAVILKGEQTSEQVLLRAPCSEVTECLGGQEFCDNPHRCNCEGDDCLAGFCDPIATDDNNDCTEFTCDNATQDTDHVPVGDGNSCGTAESGAELYCGQGLCKEPACGDFVVDIVTGEECDEGPENSNTAPGACRETCKVPSCGDGVIDNVPAFGVVYNEECDEGAANVVVGDDASNEGTFGNACRQSVTLENGTGTVLGCALPRCGDGVLNGNERCDDHNSVNGDGCNPTCSLVGQVDILAGVPGGPGDIDGIGEDASLRELIGATFLGNRVYFTSGGQVPPQVLRAISLDDNSLETVAGVIGEPGHADGIGTDALFSTPIGLDSVGTTVFIADAQNQRLKSYDSLSGAVTTIAGTGVIGSTDGPVGVASLTRPRLLAASGTTDILFVESGTSCRLRRLDRTVDEISTLAGGSSCPFPFGNNIGEIQGIAAADDGAFYISEANIIRKVELDPLTFTTIAGGGFFGEEIGNVDGTGNVARFSGPGRLALDGTNLYVADLGNASLRHIDLSVDPVVVSTLSLVDADDNEIFANDVRALAVSGTSLLMARNDESQILIGDLGADPVKFTAVAGRASGAGNVDDDGIDSLIQSRFNQPHDLALVTNQPGFLFVADSLNLGVRRVTLGAQAPKVEFLGIADSVLRALNLVGGADTLFAIFGDTGAPKLRELKPEDGTQTGPFGEIDVEMPVSRGVALIGEYLYVADPLNENILRIDRTSGEREVFAGTAGADEAIVDGPVTVAKFGNPYALVECGGDLYVAESSGTFEAHVIRKIDLSADPAVVSTVAGFATDSGSVDGVGLNARFDRPEGLACDDRDASNLILYVAESESHVIRQIELSTGRVSTLAGRPYIGLVKDGIGMEAGFNSPQGIVFDPTTGDLYVTDLAENVIRRIQ